MTAESIAHALDGRKVGSQWMVLCPAHQDRNPSLGIRDEGGKILLHCYAGCEQRAVIAALTELGLWGSSSQGPKSETRMRTGTKPELGPIVAEYNYTDQNGRTLYQVTRHEPKAFRQRYPNGRGGWIPNKYPHQVLYRLPEVLESAIVFVVEGEKDVETLRSHGFCGTTNAGGANAPWLPRFTASLRGREVILVPDKDEVGRLRVLKIARALLGHAAKIIIWEPDTEEKDISDWFAAGHSELELIAQVEGKEVAQ